MDAPPKLTKLLDLPNELLGLIVEYLDNDSLFSLSMACRALHYVALPAFFEQNDVKEPASGWVVVYKAPRRTLQALRMALFVEKLDQIHYYLNPGLDRLLGEVRELRGLVARLPSIDQVKLHFSVFDSWLDRSPPVYAERPMLDVDVWRKEFGSMLDQFLVKGCKKLHVTGGSRVWTIYALPRETMKAVMARDVEQLRSRLSTALQLSKAREEKVASRTLFGAMRRKFTSLFCKAVPAKTPLQATTPLEEPTKPPLPVTDVPQPVSSDPGIKPSLHEFYVHCEMMLQSPFLEWTRSTLQLNGECITTLSFKCIDIPSETWSDFFAALTFSSLSEFEITSDLIVRPQGPEFPCIESFLTRHPSITLLHLHGLLIPCTLPPAQDSKGILPNLVKLTAHPAYITWLLSSPDSLPCLSSITISSEYYLTPDFDYTHFDDALISIARNAGQIELGIRFSSEKGVDAWLQDHVDIGCEVSAVSQLTEIKNLAIHSFWFVEFSERTLEILPEFLALFPGLEHVRFMEQPEVNEQAMLLGGLVKAIALRCPHIKTVLINRLPLQSLA